nr:Dihydrofolate reductase [uncultured bacterium]
MKVVLIVALTADGFIGRSNHHFADWTGQADKKLFVKVTKEMGTMVMGLRTFGTIGRALPGRRTIVYAPQDEPAPEGVEITQEAPADLVARLKREGTTGLAVCGGASIYSQFMAAGVVDELYLTVVGKLFGTGVSLFSESLDVDLDLLDSTKLDAQTVLLHYAVKK